MGFDGIEKVVAGLGEEGIDGEVQRVERRSEGIVDDGRVGLDVFDGGGRFHDAGFEHGGNLLQEGVDKV